MKRTEKITIRLTPEELKELKLNVLKSSGKLSEYVRKLIFKLIGEN